MTRSRLWRPIVALTAIAALTAACGDDDDDLEATDGTEEPADDPSTDEGMADGEEIAVTAIDYEYEGMPAEIPAGSTIAFTNASQAEAHELVAFRLPEGEERPVGDLLELSEEEFGALTGGPPAVVIVAMPGGDGQVAVGSATLSEPGRYVFACFIPIGTDPALYQAAIDSGSDEAPEIPNAGPPHFTQGMSGEVTVS